jgi:hypothetical protein
MATILKQEVEDKAANAGERTRTRQADDTTELKAVEGRMSSRLSLVELLAELNVGDEGALSTHG